MGSDRVLKLVKDSGSALGAIVLIFHPLAEAFYVKNMAAGAFECFRSDFKFLVADHAFVNIFIYFYL